MQSTGKLGLKKPEGTDVVNIDDLNYNADVLDVEVTKLATPSQAGRMSAADKAKLDGIQAGAEVNQNAFSNVKVGATTISADSKTDTLELVAGANITLTPDATNDKVTIAVSGTVPQASNADTVDGAHAGTGPNNVLKLDSSGFVPIANIPSTLTGKDADTVDGLHASAFVLSSDFSVIKSNLTINVPGDYPSIQAALDSLKKIWIPRDVTVTIQVAAGTYTHTSPILIDHPCGLHINIIGATPITTNITSVGSITGSAGNWSVPINVQSTSGIVVGGYVIIRNTSGSGNFKVFEGIWEVTAINSATQLTVKNTLRKSAFPTAGLTGGNLIALKTKLVFNNSEAIKTHPLSGIGLIDNIVFIGNGAGQYSGITAGARWIADAYGDFSHPDFGPAKLSLGSNVGVTKFGGHGIALAHGGILTAMGGVCSCNNNNNGIDVGNGANAKIDNFIANGNTRNGMELGDGGTAWASNATVCGNGNRGLVSGAGSYIECTNAYVSDNIDIGMLVSNGGVIWASSAKSKNNGGNGFAAVNMGFVYATGTEASNNSTDYYAWLASAISCPSYIGSPTFSPAPNTVGNANSIISTL